MIALVVDVYVDDPSVVEMANRTASLLPSPDLVETMGWIVASFTWDRESGLSFRTSDYQSLTIMPGRVKSFTAKEL